MSTATHSFRVGDRVIVDPAGIGVSRSVLGQVFVVEKVNPKNVKARPAEGGRGINYPKHLLLPAPPEGYPTPLGRPYVEQAYVEAGSICTLKSPWSDLAVDTPLICFKGGVEKINLFRLGDTSGRYVRVPAAAVTTRDLAWLTERLVEMA
jgi:hypothetical protein